MINLGSRITLRDAIASSLRRVLGRLAGKRHRHMRSVAEPPLQLRLQAVQAPPRQTVSGRPSATKSQIVKSVSWPTADITGTEHAATALAHLRR